jgi:hypothetical protein
MKKIIFILCLSLVGCTNLPKNEDLFLKNEISLLKGTPLLKNHLLNYSYLLESYKDYLIVLNFRNEWVLQVIDRFTGEIKFSGINFGEGPQEIQIPISIFIDKTTSNIYIQDGGSNSIKSFNLNELEESNFEELKLNTEKLPPTGDRIFPVFPFEKFYLGVTLDKDMEIVKFKNSKLLDTLFQYPETVNFPDLSRKFYGIQSEGKFGMSANKKYLLKGNLYEQKITLYNLETVNKKEYLNHQEIKYKDEFIEGTGRFKWDKNRNYQYASIKEKDGKFYLLYSGINIKSDEIVLLGNEIHVFDIKSETLEKMILDTYISDFAIGEDDIIYGINFTLDDPIVSFK